jgi:transglutaminase-like putative cysteine protease
MNAREWRVGGRLSFGVEEPARVVLQVAPAVTAGNLLDERLDVSVDGRPVEGVREYRTERGGRSHVFTAHPGALVVDFAMTLQAESPRAAVAPSEGNDEREAIVALRQSRYCESDRLAGFAAAEFAGASSGDAYATAAFVSSWVFERLWYTGGASGPLDSAVDTLLAGAGVCRDFAHLTIALCRALRIPARLVSVYAPGISPMDFHAVTEVLVAGAWYVFDSTRLAPRSELVRIATGRDAADTAFATLLDGRAELLDSAVFASSEGDLADDDHLRPVALP